MKLQRRTCLSSAALTAASAAVGLRLDPGQAAEPAKKGVKLGISTYSYWHFRPPKVSIETVIEKSAAIGVSGVDILHRQMNLEEKAPLDAAGRAYCNRLKCLALTHGIDLICLSTR